MDHVLVTLANDIQMRLVTIAHCDEIGQQFTILLYREVALMLFHYRDQHRSWEFEVFFREFPAQSRRTFNQVGYLCEQIRIINHLASLIAEGDEALMGILDDIEVRKRDKHLKQVTAVDSETIFDLIENDLVLADSGEEEDEDE